MSERNAKDSIEGYRAEREKSKVAESLTERVKSLESFNKNMRMKYIMKKQETNLMKSGDKVKFSMTNGSHQDSAISDRSLKEKSEQKAFGNTNFGLGFAKPKESALSSKLINSSIYAHFFPNVKHERVRKTLLRSKNLIFKNEDFEIGSLTCKREKFLDVSLFITSLRTGIENVSLKISGDQSLKMRLSAERIDRIKVNQQEHLTLQCFLESVPYVLPSLSIRFTKSGTQDEGQLLIPVPCSFNKYFTYHTPDHTLPDNFRVPGDTVHL